MVFFDPKDGRIVMKTTLKDAETDTSGAPETPLEVIKDVRWCCKQNPDDTGILYAGAQGMTFMELGNAHSIQLFYSNKLISLKALLLSMLHHP